MRKQLKSDKPKIGMLLDPSHFYGQHEGRLAPVLTAVGVAAIAPMLYTYFGLWYVIPIPLAVPVFIIIAIRSFMIIPGREKYRLQMYKRQLYEQYTSAADMVNIKTKYPDGCVEYNNGKIMYLVVGYNGTSEDDLQLSIKRRKFMESMVDGYVFDIFIHNVTETPALTEYYDKLHVFSKNTAARNFIEIIDYSKQLATDSSLVLRTVFAIYGTKSDWKDMKTQIDSAIANKDADCYKTLYRVTDPDEIDSIINEDMDSTVVLNDLLRVKYRTGDYGSSKVLKYDIKDDEEVVLGQKPKKNAEQVSTGASFHTVFTED